jgi:hypothetical protein
MTIQLVRVINQQTLPRGLSRDGSILLDKIDRSQGNSSSPPYAQLAKQKVYVPYSNPLDTSVKGYVDLVPTDDVLLASESDGSIGGLVTAGRVTASVVASNLIAAPTLSGATNANPTVLTGTTLLSVSPDVTYAELTNLSGTKQLIPSSAFTGTFNSTTASIPDSAVTIGTPTSGWKVRVFANSKWSNQVTVP